MSTRGVGHGGFPRVYRLPFAGRYGPMSLVLWGACGGRLSVTDQEPVGGLRMLAQQPLREALLSVSSYLRQCGGGDM